MVLVLFSQINQLFFEYACLPTNKVWALTRLLHNLLQRIVRCSFFFGGVTRDQTDLRISPRRFSVTFYEPNSTNPKTNNKDRHVARSEWGRFSQFLSAGRNLSSCRCSSYRPLCCPYNASNQCCSISCSASEEN